MYLTLDKLQTGIQDVRLCLRCKDGRLMDMNKFSQTEDLM